jgi:DNA-binding CsgD family transcriptional regulator
MRWHASHTGWPGGNRPGVAIASSRRVARTLGPWSDTRPGYTKAFATRSAPSAPRSHGASRDHAPVAMKQAVIGRHSELARIDAFLAQVPAGAQVMVIEGESGMGMTTLLLAAIERATERAWRVLSARPSDAEATFAYAGIGDLLEAAQEGALAPLPAPQQRALRVALLRDEPEGGTPDLHAVAVAFLNALRGLARAGPILVAVDDVQWLDSPSALALAFAVRRLGDEPIGVLLGRRIEESPGLPLGLDRPIAGGPLARMAVGPLDPAALQHLLQARLGVTFFRATLLRIHAVSGGNPLFALELGRAIRDKPAPLEAGTELPVPDELLSLLGDQLAGLPAETQDVLAIVAALAHPQVELLAQVIDGPLDRWLQPAIGANVIAIDDGRIRFSHPLRRSAARSRTPPARRREIHARLAPIVADPEERARHLALATDGPDEATAAALEAAARRAVARGAPDAAGELAALAGRLTPPDRPDDSRRRGLAEVDYARAAGDPLRARQIAESLLATCPPGPVRGEVLHRLSYVHLALDARAATAYCRLALAEAGADDRLRLRCESVFTAASDFLGEDVREAIAHGRAELELAERLGDEVSVATALRSLARNEQLMTGRMPTELIERALALEGGVRVARPVIAWPRASFAEMLSWTDDLSMGLSEWDGLRRQATDRGDEHSLGWILAMMVPYECLAGAWEQALAHANECYALGVAAGEVPLHAVALADRALVEAHLGDTSAARSDAKEALRLGAPLGALMADRTVAWALGLLELSLGNPAGAEAQLGPLVGARRALGISEPGDLRFVPDEVEALIGIEQLAEAESLLAWFEGLARASGRVRALAASDRCRGILHGARGELDEAIAALEASRDRYATIADPCGLGRTLLLLGTTQRRSRKRLAARESLEASLAVFKSLGAKLWTERAHEELARISGRHAIGNELTQSERTVATLVAEGRSNREVAAALFLTERTIESHLSRTYAKLGVRSRSELAHRFGAEPELPR